MKTLSEDSMKFLGETLKTLMSFNDVELVVPDKYKPTLSYDNTLSKVPKIVPSVNKTI